MKKLILLFCMILLIGIVNAFTYENSNLPKLGKWTETCPADQYAYSVDFKDNEITCRADETGGAGAGGLQLGIDWNRAGEGQAARIVRLHGARLGRKPRVIRIR